MGEAWSDWYAADYLVRDGLEVDTKGKADLQLFRYDGAAASLIRTQGIDCTPSSPAARCPQDPTSTTGRTGGYTYADFGKVTASPRSTPMVRSGASRSGRSATRSAHGVSQSLVTRAMELAPYNPSFLDMRNALLVADTAHFKGKYHQKIWSTFASRGMGFFAGSLGGDDDQPSADTKTPPKNITTGVLTGTVRDNATGSPVGGVPVTLAFQGMGVTNPTAVTAADGSYSIGPVPVGHYGKLTVNGAGYVPVSRDVTVAATGSLSDFAVERNWVAVSGGAAVVGFNGPDYTDFGCGPGQALDFSLTTGWGSTTGNTKGTPTNVFVPKFLTVDMKRKVNITSFAVDPNATCGDAGSASTGAYQIETSPDNITWTVAASGTFTEFDRGRLNLVKPTQASLGIQYVRFTILGNQVPDFAVNCPDGAYDGCTFTDLTELAGLRRGRPLRHRVDCSTDGRPFGVGRRLGTYAVIRCAGSRRTPERDAP